MKKSISYLKTILIVVGLVLGTLEAQGKTFSVECTVSGLSKQSKNYKPIVKGSLVVNEQTLNELENTPMAIDQVNQEIERYCGHILNENQKNECAGRLFIPIGIRSQTFGASEGTRLQISIWKGAGISLKTVPPYLFQRVILNGKLTEASIPDGASRMNFNDDRTASVAFSSTGEYLPPEEEEQAPITTAEGQFRFISSNCRKTVTP